MARKLRVEYEGAIYHVVIRGVERRRLFDDDADRERFVCRMSELCGELEVRLYLYCLMRNHVHLLAETPGANLGVYMQRLETAYTVYYNRRHRRAGHLVQGRYKAIPVEGDDYLLKLSRYIHLNPVQVGEAKRQEPEERVKTLRGYAWSSYPAYMGRVAGVEGLDQEPVLARVGEGKKGREAYREFVETGLVERDAAFLAVLKKSQWGIGSEEFRDKMRGLYGVEVEGSRRREDASFRRVRGVVLREKKIVEAVGGVFGLWGGWERVRRRDLSRAVLARMLCKHGGKSQREVAALLGVSTGAAVSWQLKRLGRAMKEDGALVRKIARLDEDLGALRGAQEAL